MNSSIAHNDEIDETFHRLTRMAARVFKVPVAAICTVNVDKLWFASRALGPNESNPAHTLNLYDMFCQYQIQHAAEDSMLIVPNTLLDPRFQNFPLEVSIDEFHGSPTATSGIYSSGTPSRALIQFYVGMTLKVQNTIIGTFCIMDIVPRSSFTIREQNLFEEFTNMLSDLLTSNEEYVSNIYQYQQELIRERETANVVVNILSNLKNPLNKVKKAGKQLQNLVFPHSRTKNSYFCTAVSTSRVSKRAMGSVSSTFGNANRASYASTSTYLTAATENRVTFAASQDECASIAESTNIVPFGHEEGDEEEKGDDDYEMSDTYEESVKASKLSAPTRKANTITFHRTDSEKEDEEVDEEETDTLHQPSPFRTIPYSHKSNANLLLRTGTTHSMLSRQSTTSSLGISHAVASAAASFVPRVPLPPPITITTTTIQEAMLLLQQSLTFLQTMIEHSLYMNSVVLSTSSSQQAHQVNYSSSKVTRPHRRHSTTSSLLIAHSIGLYQLEQYLTSCIQEFNSSFQMQCQLQYEDMTSMNKKDDDEDDEESMHKKEKNSLTNNHEIEQNVSINVSLLWIILFFIFSRESRQYGTCTLCCKILPNPAVVGTTASSTATDTGEYSGESGGSGHSKSSTHNTTTTLHFPVIHFEMKFTNKKSSPTTTSSSTRTSMNSHQTTSSMSTSHSTSSNTLLEDSMENTGGGYDDIYTDLSSSTSSKRFDYQSEEMMLFQHFLAMFSIDHSINFATVKIPSADHPELLTTNHRGNLRHASSPLAGAVSPSSVTSKRSAISQQSGTSSHHPSNISIHSNQSHHSSATSTAATAAVSLFQKLISARALVAPFPFTTTTTGHTNHDEMHLTTSNLHSNLTAKSSTSGSTATRKRSTSVQSELSTKSGSNKDTIVTWKLFIPSHTTVHAFSYDYTRKTTTTHHQGTENNLGLSIPSKPKRRDSAAYSLHSNNGNSNTTHHARRRSVLVRQHTSVIHPAPNHSIHIHNHPAAVQQSQDGELSYTQKKITSPLRVDTNSYHSHHAAAAASSSLSLSNSSDDQTTTSTSQKKTPIPPRLQTLAQQPSTQRRSFKSFHQSFSMVRTYSRLPLNVIHPQTSTSKLSSPNTTNPPSSLSSAYFRPSLSSGSEFSGGGGGNMIGNNSFYNTTNTNTNTNNSSSLAPYPSMNSNMSSDEDGDRIGAVMDSAMIPTTLPPHATMSVDTTSKPSSQHHPVSRWSPFHAFSPHRSSGNGIGNCSTGNGASVGSSGRNEDEEDDEQTQKITANTQMKPKTCLFASSSKHQKPHPVKKNTAVGGKVVSEDKQGETYHTSHTQHGLWCFLQCLPMCVYSTSHVLSSVVQHCHEPSKSSGSPSSSIGGEEQPPLDSPLDQSILCMKPSPVKMNRRKQQQYEYHTPSTDPLNTPSSHHTKLSPSPSSSPQTPSSSSWKHYLPTWWSGKYHPTEQQTYPHHNKHNHHNHNNHTHYNHTNSGSMHSNNSVTFLFNYHNSNSNSTSIHFRNGFIPAMPATISPSRKIHPIPLPVSSPLPSPPTNMMSIDSSL